MTNLDSIGKSRDITLATKVHLVKAMVFPVVMYQGWACRLCLGCWVSWGNLLVPGRQGPCRAEWLQQGVTRQ